jgi:hypothetical protein
MDSNFTRAAEIYFENLATEKDLNTLALGGQQPAKQRLPPYRRETLGPRPDREVPRRSLIDSFRESVRLPFGVVEPVFRPKRFRFCCFGPSPFGA